MARMYTLPMSAWVNFANYMVESSVERMQEATERMQKREYTPGHLFADAVGFWMDGVDAWWCSFQQTIAGPVPFAFIKMRPDDESARCELPIRKVEGGTLEATDLMQLGGAAKGSLSVIPTWNTGRPNCAVTIARALDAKGTPLRGRLKEGLYQSSIHLDEKLVAIVQILVEG